MLDELAGDLERRSEHYQIQSVLGRFALVQEGGSL